MFRRVLLRVGEIRSLLPSEVSMLALTATATITLRKHVISILGMRNPYIVSLSPCKENITYNVINFKSIIETFTPLLKSLLLYRTNAPRVIIFCQKIGQCSIYMNFSRMV